MPLRHRYRATTVVLLLTEVAIALFVRDSIVRPYAGDSLAVGLVYCALRGVTPLRIGPAMTITLAIAGGIEVGQWFGLVDRLGLGGNRIAAVVLGTGFDPRDFLAYGLGGAVILLAEAIWLRRC